MARGRRRAASGPGSNSAVSPKRSRQEEANDREKREARLGDDAQEGRRNILSAREFREALAILKPVESKKDTELKVKSVDFNIDSNRESHHTSEYEQEELIVRRGQSFDLTLTFQREYDPAKDKITLQFVFGNRPKESKRTLLRVPLSTDAIDTTEKWQVLLVSHSGSEVKVAVTAAAEEAIVGRYGFFVETVSVGEEDTWRHRYEGVEQFVLLFNPWCKGDDVYMEEDTHKEEYVLNENGRLWWGTAKSPSSAPWNFGQFDDVSLEAALYLLDKAELSDGARSNPVLVGRTLSKLANSNDEDGGVLTGRWHKPYPKGTTPPWAWAGSVAILEQFMKTKSEVQYGQCWVFSGLVTTLLRTLGIPARSVTNFQSAHDSDVSTTVDVHWDEEGNPLTDWNDDSVWNFHVWNEAWMRRTDLPSGYDGWQALDSTPQEVSEGVMQCGPVPVKAVKEGHIYLPYDGAFVFAEVNGDRINWQVSEDGSLTLMSKEKDSIGKMISTTALGSNDRHDLTLDYKYAEGSPEERAAVKRAHQYARYPKEGAYDIPEPDVTFTLITPDLAEIGDDLEITIEIQNTVEEKRNVNIRVSTMVSYYTGVTSERVGVETLEEELDGNEFRSCVVKVPAADYMPYIQPEASMQVFMRGMVVETKRSYAHSESFILHKPTLKLQAPEKVEVGEEFEFEITFTNPLKEKLTGSVFHIEGSRIIKPTTIHHKKAVGAGESVTEMLTLMATRSGKREIVVTFSSDQVTGVAESFEIYVKYQA